MNEVDVIVVGGGPRARPPPRPARNGGCRLPCLSTPAFRATRSVAMSSTRTVRPGPGPTRCGTEEYRSYRNKQSRERQLHRNGPSHTYRSPCPVRTVAIRRSLLDTALLDHARSCSGVHVVEDETVHDVLTNHRAVATSHGVYGARTAIIGADGRHSVVARKAGLACLRRGSHQHVAFQSPFPRTRDIGSPGAIASVPRRLLRPGARGCRARQSLHRGSSPWAARFHRDCEALFRAHGLAEPPFPRACGVAPEPLGFLSRAPIRSKRRPIARRDMACFSPPATLCV